MPFLMPWDVPHTLTHSIRIAHTDATLVALGLQPCHICYAVSVSS